jgi:hypothetical protein
VSHHVGLLFCGQEFFASVDKWDAYVDDKRRSVIGVIYTGLQPCAGHHHLKTLLGRVELGRVVQVHHLDDGRVEAAFLSEDTLI